MMTDSSYMVCKQQICDWPGYPRPRLGINMEFMGNSLTKCCRTVHIAASNGSGFRYCQQRTVYPFKQTRR